MTAKILYSVPVAVQSLLTGKFPGYRLVKTLEEHDCFEVVLVPATLTGAKTMMEKFHLLFNYFIKTILITLDFRDDMYFYNFQKSYVPIYVLYVLFHFKRPNLFLADGVNCFGLRQVGHKKFFKYFNKIVSLPYFSNNLRGEDDRIFWFPGPLELNQSRTSKKKQNPNFVYNSSLLPYNEPERAIDLAIQNDELDICFTGTRRAMENYLNTNNLAKYLEKLNGLNFTGDLPQKEYANLLKSANGVLLFRNEEYFENQYNFPSKLLECLQLGVPLISFYNINGVPESLYRRVTSCMDTEEFMRAANSPASYDLEAIEFINRCNPRALRDFIQASLN